MKDLNLGRREKFEDDQVIEIFDNESPTTYGTTIPLAKKDV